MKFAIASFFYSHDNSLVASIATHHAARTFFIPVSDFQFLTIISIWEAISLDLLHLIWSLTGPSPRSFNMSIIDELLHLDASLYFC